MINYFKLSPKNIFIFISSGISSVGTFPYGFRFANLIFPHNHWQFLLLGFVLSISAVVANIALGSYSLLRIDFKKNFNIWLMLISLISAIPMGFICYFAYLSYLPIYVDRILSIIVILVNSAISYTAMSNLFLEITKFKTQEVSRIDKVFRIFGFTIGMSVSFVACIATIAGIQHIFGIMYVNEANPNKIAYLFGFITWIPYSALFSNATQMAASRFYHSSLIFKEILIKLKFEHIFLFTISLCSGAAFAQIIIDFFSMNMNIPSIFMTPIAHKYISRYLVPLAFFASSSVNYFALNNLFDYLKANKIHS